MPTASFAARRSDLEHYFDRTARDAWAQLTSDAPVSGIRATVRAGRDRMRETLLSWLPDNLSGSALLDAGCGTGALSVEAAQRGARVTAVDVSEGLVNVARERTPGHLAGRIDWRAGDMTAEAGPFDHVVAMDSLIHYEPVDVVRARVRLAAPARRSVAFTFAPRTPLLTVMWFAGRAFPRADRAPAIVPVTLDGLSRAIKAAPELADWRIGRTRRIQSGFYTSQALELVRK